ncbi:MAG: hypothetical protein KDK90_25565 [Leptospiraceae bacterium]|nr:hypothetical protein [Leptospiraceae bacterium]
MPKFDFTNKKIPEGYKLPEPPIELVENMKIEDVHDFISQELYKIYQSNDNYLIQEMRKEDIFGMLVEKHYNMDELFPIEE